MEKTLLVEGMSCNHCKMRVEKALLAVEGVKNAVVDLDQKNAKVTLSASVPDETLVQAVVDAGYEVKGVL